MKKKKPKNQNLQKLIKDWDRKLKESGFNDIEERDTDRLKSWAGNVALNNEICDRSRKTDYKHKYGYTSLTWKESQEEYYRIAGQCLHEAEFKSEKHKIIWQLHCEGLTNKEIADKINAKKHQVKYAINRMAKDFGLIF